MKLAGEERAKARQGDLAAIHDSLTMNPLLPKDSVILFISSAPRDQDAVGSGVEYRAIQKSVGIHFQLTAALAAEPADLVDAIVRYKPRVVHFSGHGLGIQGLVLQDGKQKTKLYSSKALDQLLAARGMMEPVRLFVLNGCRTEEQAKKITPHGKDTVATRIDLLDELAVAFAGKFYLHLCSLPPRDAFDSAIAALVAENLPETEGFEYHPGRGNPKPGEPSADPEPAGHLPLPAVPTATRSRPTTPPQELPSLCDRSDQIGALEEFFDKLEVTSFRRPVLVVVHGELNEAHSTFVRRLTERELPSKFRLRGFGNVIEHLQPTSRLTAKDPDGLAQQIRTKLMHGMQLEKRCKDDQELINCFDEIGATVLAPVFDFNSQEAFAGVRCYVSMIRDYWAKFPDLPAGMALLNFLCIKYVEPPSTSFFGRLFSSKRHDPRAKLRSAVKELDTGLPAAGGVKVIPKVLEELRPVKVEHVVQWFEQPEVDCSVRPRMSVDTIKARIFQGRPALPMDQMLVLTCSDKRYDVMCLPWHGRRP